MDQSPIKGAQPKPRIPRCSRTNGFVHFPARPAVASTSPCPSQSLIADAPGYGDPTRPITGSLQSTHHGAPKMTRIRSGGGQHDLYALRPIEGQAESFRRLRQWMLGCDDGENVDLSIVNETNSVSEFFPEPE